MMASITHANGAINYQTIDGQPEALMKKQLITAALAFTLATSAALAAIPRTSLDWIDNVPGLKLHKIDYDHDELQKEYTFVSKSSYQAVINGFTKKGWQITNQVPEYGVPEMPTVFLIKNNLRAKIDVDRKHGYQGDYFKLEVEIKAPHRHHDYDDDDYDYDDYDD